MDIKIIIDSIYSASLQITPLVVKLVVALIVVLVGFVVARVVGLAAAWLLKLVRLDAWSKKVGFAQLLEKGEIKRTISDLSGDLLYWLIIFMVIIGIAKSYDLSLEPAFAYLLSYLGIVFLAAIVLGIGLFFATLLSGIVRVIAVNLGIEGAKTLSRTIYYIVVILTFLAALAQMGLKSDVFIPQIGVIIGAVGLAAAIAFGLGCKDMAADFLHNLFKGK